MKGTARDTSASQTGGASSTNSMSLSSSCASFDQRYGHCAPSGSKSAWQESGLLCFSVLLHDTVEPGKPRPQGRKAEHPLSLSSRAALLLGEVVYITIGALKGAREASQNEERDGRSSVPSPASGAPRAPARWPNPLSRRSRPRIPRGWSQAQITAGRPDGLALSSRVASRRSVFFLMGTNLRRR